MYKKRSFLHFFYFSFVAIAINKTTGKSKIPIIIYIIFLIVSLIVGSMLGGIYLAVAIVLDVVLLLLLIYHHSSKYDYICPSCNKRFSITFFQDMFSLNNGKKGKYLRCPYCNQKNWIQEKIKGKLDK